MSITVAYGTEPCVKEAVNLMDRLKLPKEKRSAHRTQWAAQFAVASELCKRGAMRPLWLI
jgi:hypothetical protein